MNDLDDNLGQGVLYVSGTRGYSAYEIAVQNGFVGTEQEWLDSLVGPQGEPGTPFDELTEEQKEEIRGDEGKSAYEIAVENGFIGTEQDWINSFLTPDGYYTKDEINTLPLSHFEFRNVLELEYDSQSDFYEGQAHFSLQGWCYCNNSIVMALISTNYTNNYARLVEADVTTKEVLRETYLELHHANSITYNRKDNKLYVAACNTINGSGGNQTNNDINVVDYSTFSVIKTIQISNIPTGHRIRSVYYDNDENVLYGGDIYDMFVIDEENELITKTISLEQKYFTTGVTNQTLKKYKNMYVGLYLRYFVFWNMEGKVIRVSNVEAINSYQNLGEPEDFDFDPDGNMWLGGVKRRSGRYNKYIAGFYKTNIFKGLNTALPFEQQASDTNSITLYVDSDSTTASTIGTETYPFKSLQQAVNVAKRLDYQGCDIVVKGSYHENCYIPKVAGLSINFIDDCTINGFEIYQSDVEIYSSNSKSITINGIYGLNSNINVHFDSDKRATLNCYTNESSTYNNKAFYLNNCRGRLVGLNVFGDNTNQNCNIVGGSVVALEYINFDDYENNYAIYISHGSLVSLYEVYFLITATTTQQNVFIGSGATLFSRLGLIDKNNYNVVDQGKVYPSIGLITLDNYAFYNWTHNIDTHYSHIELRVHCAGSTSTYQHFEILTNRNGYYTLTTTFIKQDGTTVIGQLAVNVNNGVLSIYHNRTLTIALDGTRTLSELTTDTPENPNDYVYIISLRYLLK